ncbi:hypothetical protein BU15DRAFT_68118 [Melanogaster broomeanus]|nr:hypothetical protein BU15DRAFT_68118 [Melanogaster broomeanus]
MAYAIELNDGTIIEVPDLATDGSNWKTYRDNLIHIAAIENLVQQLDGTDAKPVDVTQHELKAWEQRNEMAKLPIMLTIPDSLLIHVMHLETAREWFKYLADRFETKTSDVTQREASCNPRRRVSTHQKHSEDARKLQECKATVNQPKIAKVTEPCDSTHRERKRNARSEGRVEKRVRRGRKAAERTSEQEAGAREPGKEAADEAIHSISLAVMPSSQDDDGRDTGVPCTTVNPHKPKSTHPVASEAAADAANPDATSAMPTEPAGGSPKPQDESHESTDQNRQRPSSPHNETAASAPPSVPFEGERESEVKKGKDERLKRRDSEKVAAARAPGENTVDQGADGVSLAPPASSLNGHGVETSTDETTNTTAATPSMPLEGERDAQRRTSGTRTGQQHGTNVHSEGHSARMERHASCTTNGGPRVPDGIVEDPGGHVKPHMPGKPPSILLEGECNAERHTSGACTGQQRSAIAHGEGPHAWAARHISYATSGTSRDPKRMKTGPLAEVRARQDCRYVHRPYNDVPEPCTPLPNDTKRPTKHVNPPRRRERLKPRNPRARVNRARAYEETRTQSRRDHPRSIGYHLGMLGEHPRPSETKPEG